MRIGLGYCGSVLELVLWSSGGGSLFPGGRHELCVGWDGCILIMAYHS